MSISMNMTEDRISLTEDDEEICWYQECIQDNTAVILLGGKLRTDTAYVFMDELTALVSVGMSLVLDFEKVEYLSNAYLKAMRFVQHSVDKDNKQELILRNLSAPAKEAMNKVGITSLFHIQ